RRARAGDRWQHPGRRNGAEGRRGGKQRSGRVDTLVSNAGIFIAKPFLEYAQEDFHAVTARPRV
ncbi:MAG TPA: hypothetical protein VGY54_12635, partial [Polyangiaceae bacterium]|nr:hypothetical protein [Polyangiaceae bacterium]